MSKHVVFGVGQVGRHVAARLVQLGHEVVTISRSGGPTVDGARSLAGDVTDPAFADQATTGAATVYFCLNAPSYRNWPRDFPPLQNAVLMAARANGARLVALENLYAYGPTAGRPLREDTPVQPPNAKSLTRAAMSAQLLDAHARGDVAVTIGRAADLFGPGVTASSLGEQVFKAALRGGRAQTMGDPDTPHTYSYAPDVGYHLATLGCSDEAFGRAWHLPNPPTQTTREVMAQIYAAAGTRRRMLVARRPLLWSIGLVNGDARELRSTYYQFSAPFIVDDRAFRAAFVTTDTPWQKAIEATLDYYRSERL